MQQKNSPLPFTKRLMQQKHSPLPRAQGLAPPNDHLMNAICLRSSVLASCLYTWKPPAGIERVKLTKVRPSRRSLGCAVLRSPGMPSPCSCTCGPWYTPCIEQVWGGVHGTSIYMPLLVLCAVSVHRGPVCIQHSQRSCVHSAFTEIVCALVL